MAAAILVAFVQSREPRRDAAQLQLSMATPSVLSAMMQRTDGQQQQQGPSIAALLVANHGAMNDGGRKKE
jgi:hypothetical protein